MFIHSGQNIDDATSRKFFRDIDRVPESVYVIHWKTEVRYPEHCHNKGQLIYIEGGIAYIHLPHRTLVIPARHYVWIPAGQKHFVEMHKSVITRTIYFYSHDDAGNPFYGKGGIYPINTLLLQMLSYSERWSGDVMPDDHDFHFLAAIKNILPEISKNAFPIVLPTTENTRMNPVLKYMNKHLFEQLTLTSVSEANGFSERTLSRLFQSTLSTSFLQYFKLLRMVKAIELMQQNDLSASEIAYQLGYNSVSAFSAIFYQLTKTRPSEFARQLHQ
ncbi:helix-turn-helix transcriptional regulator [Mucilaginibacter gynuensis]|uniref:Helix-turn-helix transcriptional regulator n=1 Tax=Mucilaginibacter gynuensis TaxID=1302236 RepID=A0ABP8FVW3_9SPHI